MAVNIKLKRSSVQGNIPTVAQLELGELALNTRDGRAFMKIQTPTTTSIVEFATTAGTGSSVTSASYATSASFAYYSINAGNASTANFATSASHAANSISASFAIQAQTASYVPIATSASYAISSSFAYQAQTASSADSFVVRNSATASNLLVTDTITAQKLVVQFVTSSQELITGSLVVSGSLNAYGGVTGSLLGTASFAVSSSYNQSSSYANSASFAVYTQTSSHAEYAKSASYAATASYVNPLTQNVSITGSLNVSAGITGSFSGSLANLQGTPTYIPFFSSSQVLANSAMYQVGTASIAINETNITTANPEALYVFQTHPTSINVVTGKGNLNHYLQNNIQNTNQGVSASSDVVATANNGDENGFYIDMGINSENYNQGFVGGANDAYVYAIANNLHIGNAATGSQHLGFFVGGSDVEANNKLQLNPNNQHQMSGSLNISGSLTVRNGITGSLFGTASWAISSSFNQSSSYANSASYAATAISASYAQSASYANSASYAATAISASYAQSSSFANSASYATEAVNAQSASYAGAYTLTSSFNSFTSSYLTDSASFDTRITTNSASIALLSSSFLSASASFDTRINNLTESVFTHVVTNSGASNYIIDGVTKPVLSFVPGATYRFNTSGVVGTHPFKFSTSPNGPTEYTTGVISGSNFIQIEVNYDTPTVLYYYCTIHSGMGNEIDILRINTLNTGSFTGSFTGSILGNLTGTSSFATSASYANSASYSATAISASYAESSSFANSSSYAATAISASYAQSSSYANSSSFAYQAQTASYANDFTVKGTITAQTLVVQIITSSQELITGSLIVSGALEAYGGITGSLLGTASFATSASYANSASYAATAISASYAESSSFANSSSYAATAISASYAQSASYTNSSSYAATAISASYAQSASFANSASYAATAISASYAANADLLDGRDSSVFATTGSNIFVGNQTVTGSLFTTGSNTLVGSTILTGSLNISGSETIKGYIQFEPVTTNINNSISASYIYVSGSTNDLYFTQNGNGYGNTTRLRWLEGNLYTGLLHGGLITITTGSTTFNLNSGSGIVVNLNASLGDDPYPTITYINWGNFTNVPITYLTSSIQSYIGIDSNGQITQQNTPFSDGEYNTKILIGTVLHQNQTTVNASITYPNVAYGWKQRSYDFVKAFGPLKLSGYTIAPSSSLGLTIGSGTAWADGRNYQTDPNNPSYITDPGTSVSKIFRYYQSGSAFVQDTNGGLGYTVVDPANYNNNGTLTNVSPSTPFTIQRVFWYPNSATKGIVVYYGNAQYNSIAEAAANLNFETFNEVENTKQNAVYLGAIIIKYNGTFASTSDYSILPGGIFRSVGGSGGGGSVVTARLVDLTDVAISGPTGGQPLAYDAVNLKWKNLSYISASISGNAVTATSASYANSASYAAIAISASYAQSASYANSASYAATAISASYAESASYANSSSFAYQANTASSADNFTVRGTITAQQLIVQFITSSQELITGSLIVSGSLTALGGVTGSLLGTSSWANNAISASYALTSSNVQGGLATYIPLWNTNTSLSSSYLNQSGSVLKTTYGVDKGLSLDFNYDSYILGNPGTGNNTYLQVFDGGSVINVYSPNYTYFNDKVGIRIIPTNPGLAVSGSLEVTGPGTTKFMNTNVQIGGNLFMSGSNRLIYNNDATNNMLFGMFDGSNIYGPYYQLFGNNYSNVTQRGSAEFVYDTRNGGESGFNIASFNGSTWTRKLRVDDNGVQITGSLNVTGGITGSLLGTASFAISASQAFSSSYALTASYAENVPATASFAISSSNANTATTASYALTASFAMNGGGGGLSALYIQDEGITQGTASYIDFVGTGVTATVSAGTASINISGGGGSAVQGASQTFTQSIAANTWSFSHGINSRTPVVEVYDSNYNVILPSNIYNPGPYQTNIYFDVAQSGYAIISTGGVLAVSGANAVLNQNSASTTWSFSHDLHTQYPVFTIYDSNNDVIIPQRINVVDTASAVIYFSTPRTGKAVASVGGNISFASSSLSSSYATTSSYALTASYLENYIPPFPYTGSAAISGSLSVNGDISSTGTITAQTLYVQFVTSSIAYVTGSTQFGSLISNTHQFTGSVDITGSLTVNGSSAILSNQTSSMSVASASLAQAAISASHAASAISSSYALTASYASNVPATASFAISASQANSASYALTASYSLSGTGFPFSGSAVITGSLLVSGSGITGSLNGTASYALTASYASNVPDTASFAISSSQAFSSSYAISASYATYASNTPGTTIQFSQSVAATTWSFVHNLNTRNPIVQVYDTNYKQIIPNDVVGVDVNTAEVRFDYAQAGYVVMSNGGGLYVTGSTSELVQTVGATTWSFTHNLNSKYIAFEIYDSNDYVIIPAGIRVIDTNSAEIYFATAQTGRAVAQFSGINGAPNATTASYAFTASYASVFTLDRALLDYAQVNSSIVGSNNLYTQATGSYTAAFFKYTVASGSNARAGEVSAVWNGTTVEFTDVSTNDIGSTSAVTSSVTIAGTDVQFNVQTNTSGWRIKSTATFM